MALKQSGLVAALNGREHRGDDRHPRRVRVRGPDRQRRRDVVQDDAPAAQPSSQGGRRRDGSARDLGLRLQRRVRGHVGPGGQLKGSLSKLSAEQRNAALSTIFGSDAVRAAAVLYDQGSDGIAKWTRDVNDSGFAADQAARPDRQPRGDIERLGGSLDTALIKSGSGANDALRGLSQGLESAVNWFSPASCSGSDRSGPGPVQRPPPSSCLAGWSLTAIPKIQAFKVAMADMGLTAQLSSSRVATAAKSIGILTAAAAGLSVAYAGMQGVVNDWAGANDDAVKSLDALLKGGTRAEGVTMLMRDGFNDLGASVERVFNESLWMGHEPTRRHHVPGRIERRFEHRVLQQLDKALSGFVSSGKADQAAEIFKRVTDEASQQGASLWPDCKEAFPVCRRAGRRRGSLRTGCESRRPRPSLLSGTTSRRRRRRPKRPRRMPMLSKGFASPFSMLARRTGSEIGVHRRGREGAQRATARRSRTAHRQGRDNARALDAMTRAAIDNVGAMQANRANQATLQASLETSVNGSRRWPSGSA